MSMSTKELAMETIRDLPEDTSWQEIEERIRFLLPSRRVGARSGGVKWCPMKRFAICCRHGLRNRLVQDGPRRSA